METKAAPVLAPIVFLIVLQLVFSTAEADQGGHGPPVIIPSPSFPCPPSVANFTNTLHLPFKMSSPDCSSPWPLDLVLVYEQSGRSRWSFILAAPDYNGYIAVGSSPTGRMIGSSAIVGWVSGSGRGIVKQYYLGGYNSTACLPGKGNLKIVPGSTAIVSNSKQLLLAFQLHFTGAPDPHVILAVGPPKRLPGPDFRLPMHYARTSAIIQ